MRNVLRTWPYFKFYPNDWLTSNTVKLMNNAQRGAYLALLCMAWSEESCTVPAESALLQKLSQWEGTVEEFASILTCFPLTRNKQRRYNPRLLTERQEAVAYRTKQSEGGRKGMAARWAAKPVVRKRRTTEQAPPRDWLAALKANPLYAHIDWVRETGKMHVWNNKPANQHRKITQSFVINWINKIDPPLSNGAGQSLTCPDHPTLTFPDTTAKATHEFLHHPKYVG